MEDRIRMQILKMAIASPKARLLGYGCRAVAQCTRTPRLGLIAQAKLTRPAKAAVAARQILFERYPIAFAQAPAPLRNRADAMDAPDILVSHDANGAICLIRLPVAAADSRRLDFEDASVGRNLRKRILADLRLESANRSCGKYVFGHPS